MGGCIAFPGPELYALVGGRGSVREGKELPWHLLRAFILEYSP